VSDEQRGNVPWALLVGGIVCLDQVSKALVQQSMGLHETRPLVDGFLSLTHVRNRGAAFGLLSDADIPFQAALFAIVSVAALVAIAVYAFRLPPKSTLPRAGMALILAGAVGNLIDRALLGFVIDFIDVYWRSHHWPAFNVADSAITVGVALLLLDSVFSPQPQPKGELQDAPASAPSPGRSE
jgi:signal peptidase II